MDRLRKLVESLNCEPKDKKILSSFLFTIPGHTLTYSPVLSTKKQKECTYQEIEEI